MAVRIFSFIPAVLAVITDLVAAVVVRQGQPDYPVQFLAFQIVMAGAALLVAAPERWLRHGAVLVLLIGVLLSGMSVGVFYIPTLLAACWIVAMRPSDRATPSFLDTKPQGRVIYTESDLEAMKYRQSR